MTSSVDGGKRHELDSLISNLRKNLQTFSDAPVESQPYPKPPSVVVASSICGNQDVISPVIMEKPKHHFYLCWFMNKCLLTSQIYVFFIVMLSILRPSFLYYDEKIASERRRNMIRTRFSVFYLFIWAALFTMVIHIMIFVQKKVALAYPLDP